MVSVLNISCFGESSICTRMQFVGTSSETVFVFKFNLKNLRGYRHHAYKHYSNSIIRRVFGIWYLKLQSTQKRTSTSSFKNT